MTRNLTAFNQQIITRLQTLYPEPTCELTHHNPLELLVATILSAQCTDKRVNLVTPALFSKYRTAHDFAEADISALENDIRSTGFFRNKAANIKKCCKVLADTYGGQVPQSMAELQALPGIGRKTANVILGNVFGIAAGIAVDTHVTRLSGLLGLSRSKTAEKIEMDLMAITPPDQWVDYSHLLILHGRYVCVARKPKCQECILKELCPSVKI